MEASDEKMYELVCNFCKAKDSGDSETLSTVYQTINDLLYGFYFNEAKASVISSGRMYDVSKENWEDTFSATVLALYSTELDVWRGKYKKSNLSFKSFVCTNVVRELHKIKAGENSVDPNVMYLFGKIRQVSENYGLPIVTANYHIFALVLRTNNAHIASTIEKYHKLTPLDPTNTDIVDNEERTVVYNKKTDESDY